MKCQLGSKLKEVLVINQQKQVKEIAKVRLLTLKMYSPPKMKKGLHHAVCNFLVG